MLRTKTSRGSTSSVVSAIIAILLLGASAWMWLNRQYVVDQIAVWQYQPTAAIAGFAERTTMTDGGKFYLYASHPSLEKTQAFNAKCDRKEATAAVLGCYATGKIFIYDITNEQLDGIREVTVAHETLHAVYERMDESEKRRINQLLEAQYAKLQGNKELADRMAFYERAQPGERDNELHSILGTEFSGLGDELEKYYSQYFSNRQTIVDLHSKYATVFNSLKSQAEALAAQLQSLAAQIQTDSDSYNSSVRQLNNDIETFNSRASSGGYSSQAQFNVERQTLTARVDAIANSRGAIDANINKYETLRVQYNQIADTSQSLYDSIDSTLAPAPSI